VEAERFGAVMNLPTRPLSFDELVEFDVEKWAEGPFLTEDEVQALSIRKGSLSEFERDLINSHVSHTYRFLQKLPWTRELKRIPEIAWAHHEKLDGSGYPRGIKAEEIRIESRMMTISDIYDALVAWDRPYKSSVSAERALGILEDEAAAGKLDRQLLRVFLEARIFDLPEFKDLLPPRASGR
jgi:response regulator RpfG family c-di-GMP phosphodiesterase